MAGSNTFLPFDENKTNILSDDAYANDTDRQNGFIQGIARSQAVNKVLRQTSVMSAALGDLIKDSGGNASDSDLVALKQALVQMIQNYYSPNLSILKRNELKMLLGTAGKFSGVNAWSDDLSDASWLNTGASSGYVVDNGSAKFFNQFSSTNSTGSYIVGYSNGYWYECGQAFKTPCDIPNGTKIKFATTVSKLGDSPPPSYTFSLYASDTPSGTPLASTTFNYADLQIGKQNEFTLTIGQDLLANTAYCITFSYNELTDGGSLLFPSSSYNNYNNYGGSGMEHKYPGTGGWVKGRYMVGTMTFEYPSQYNKAVVIWQLKTSEGILKQAIVEADQTLNTGTVTYYISRDNGTTFTQCPLDTLVDISGQPPGTNIVLKAVITGDAQINCVAWGGLT